MRDKYILTLLLKDIFFLIPQFYLLGFAWSFLYATANNIPLYFLPIKDYFLSFGVFIYIILITFLLISPFLPPLLLLRINQREKESCRDKYFRIFKRKIRKEALLIPLLSGIGCSAIGILFYSIELGISIAKYEISLHHGLFQISLIFSCTLLFLSIFIFFNSYCKHAETRRKCYSKLLQSSALSSASFGFVLYSWVNLFWEASFHIIPEPIRTYKFLLIFIISLAVTIIVVYVKFLLKVYNLVFEGIRWRFFLSKEFLKLNIIFISLLTILYTMGFKEPINAPARFLHIGYIPAKIYMKKKESFDITLGVILWMSNEYIIFREYWLSNTSSKYIWIIPKENIRQIELLPGTLTHIY